MEIIETATGASIRSEKRTLNLDGTVATLEGFVIDHPGEYEKSGVLVHVEEFGDKMLFLFHLENKNVAYVPYSELDWNESMANFYQTVDVLLIQGSKASLSTIENLETRVLVPFGAEKEMLITALGQNAFAPVTSYKSKEADFEGEQLMIVHLGEEA